MELEKVIDLIIKYEDKLLKHYRESLLTNFKKNSKSSQPLSERQYFILYVILYKEINTITDIAHYLNLSKANISILASKLEDNNYITRDKNSNVDSRVSTLVVTELGKNVFENARSQLALTVRNKIEQYKDTNIDLLDIFINLKRVVNIEEEINAAEDMFLLISMKINNIFEDVYTNIIKNKKLNLSVAEFKIIKTLDMLEKANFELLTEVMCLSYSTLSLQVKGLEKKGYISKEKCFDDGRVTFLTLTSSGQEVCNIFNKEKYTRITSRLSYKTKEEISDLVNVFNSLFIVLDALDVNNS